MSYIKYIFVILTLLLSVSCEKEKTEPNVVEDEQIKFFVDDLLDYYYFWNYDIQDASKQLDLYSDYFDAKLSSLDRWSYMMDRKSWVENETGIFLSYGFSITQAFEYYEDYSLRVRYVFPNSPMSDKGVKRGWVLTHLAGVPVMDLLIQDKFDEEFNKASNTFRFEDTEGKSHEFEATARQIQTASYLHKDIYTSEDFSGLTKKVGYFNYVTFNPNMLDDIKGAFSEFNEQGIEDLILDLRYNPGGDLRATELLANYIAPASAEGKVFTYRKMNDNLKLQEDESIIRIKREEDALDLDRIFIITGSGSASASELIINGMRPLFGDVNTIAVGDTTYGKPNGMFAIPYPMGPAEDMYRDAQYVFLPICFYSVNARGEGDYENGLLPTEYIPEDIKNDWGVDELLIKSCLNYIVKGDFPDYRTKTKHTLSNTGGVILLTPESDPNYGLDIQPFVLFHHKLF